MTNPNFRERFFESMKSSENKAGSLDELEEREQMDNNKKAMRKLKLHVAMSLDGCIAGPNNEMDWIDFTWDKKLRECEHMLHKSVDTILLGRKMTNEFISYWSNVMNKPEDPEYTFAKKMMETPKIVFTKTLNKSEWPNTEIATGDLKDEITKLKSQ